MVSSDLVAAALAGGVAAEATGVTDVTPIGRDGGGGGRDGGGPPGSPLSLPPILAGGPSPRQGPSVPPGLAGLLGALAAGGRSVGEAASGAAGGAVPVPTGGSGLDLGGLDAGGGLDLGGGGLDFGLPDLPGAGGGDGGTSGGRTDAGRPPDGSRDGFALQDLAGTSGLGTAVATVGEAGAAGGSTVNDVVTGAGEIVGDPGAAVDGEDPGGLLGVSFGAGQATGAAVNEVTPDTTSDPSAPGGTSVEDTGVIPSPGGIAGALAPGETAASGREKAREATAGLSLAGGGGTSNEGSVDREEVPSGGRDSDGSFTVGPDLSRDSDGSFTVGGSSSGSSGTADRQAVEAAKETTRASGSSKDKTKKERREEDVQESATAAFRDAGAL